MKQIQVHISTTLACLLLCSTSLLAQIDVEVVITNGSSTTTCTDFLSAPEPMWSVDIENEGIAYYPETGNCFTPLPNTQYTASFSCPADLPNEIQVCFQAFENDPIVPIGCLIAEDCLEEICENFVVPAPGNSIDYTLALPAGGDSEGEVNFTISTSASVLSPNDDICNAIDLGTMTNGGTLGDNTQGIYNNLCATNGNEPNPNDDNFWYNDAGVWFTFTTGDDTNGRLELVEVLNDPEGTGEEIDVQIAAYATDNGACDGNMTLIGSVTDNNTTDGRLKLTCLDPNTTYFILVDGAPTTDETIQGVFGIQVRNIGVQEGGNLRCEAEDFGPIPVDGSVTIGPRANFCADDSDDPFVSAFVSQHSVWFRFIAPPSGHILIEGFSEDEEVPLGIQLALHRPLVGTCTGFFQHISSIYTQADLDESLEATCLFPGEPYYILVDGSGGDSRGVFTLTVSDAGDITPITNQDITLCAGESLVVGTSIYTESGVYADTLQLFAGCDSIVNSTLTVLDELVLSVNEISPAIGEGNANAVYEATATGGTGNYTFEWCNGETTATATMLVGGENCCVTVTDDNGCMDEVCFDINFTTDIVPTFTEDLLDCNGDEDGIITFSAVNGIPPYNYTWQNNDNSINGAGTINFEGEVIQIEDLPAGDYTFTIADEFDDTTFVAMVTEPAPIVISLVEVVDASCFGECDGTIEVMAEGGTGAFTYTWSGGLSGGNTPSAVCAGTYMVTATDANNCEATFMLDVGEPEEFIATATQVQAVSCFEGSDGQATVETNGNPIAYEWDNNEDEQTISDLSAGFYTVTVTNDDGCQAVATIEITEPNAPVEVSIELVSSISCNGETDGGLSANVTGPGTSFTYNWSSGSTQAFADNLGAGDYTLTVMNENGCEATASFTLTEPDEVSATLSSVDITCLDPPNGGAIRLDEVIGGVPPYSYSLDGIEFSNVPAFAGLFEGEYEVLVQDAAGCEKIYPIEVLGPPEVTVSLGDDQEIRLGESIELTALTNSTNPVFNWEPKIDSISASDGSSIIVTPLTTSAFSVTVMDSVTFCTATDNVIIAINKERKVYIPNAFSPNLDGLNDIFMVHGGLGIVEVKTFKVFTRNGMLVYEADGFMPDTPENGWDGNFNGKEMNTGVYVYFAEIEFIDGLTEVFKGDVTLMR